MGTPRLRLIGHSWGATLALLYSARYPQQVDRAVLVSLGPLSSELATPAQANMAGGQQVNFKYPLTLQFAGAQTSQDDCNPPKVTVTVAVPPPTPAPPAGLTAALPVKPLPIMISKTPVPVKPSPTGVPASKLVKNWMNVDPNTEGITSMMITPSGGSLNVETFGKCTPKDCDWGAVQVPYAGTGPLTVPYKFSFKTTTLSAILDADWLNVTEDDHYTDSSGRPDRQVKYQLH